MYSTYYSGPKMEGRFYEELFIFKCVGSINFQQVCLFSNTNRFIVLLSFPLSSLSKYSSHTTFCIKTRWWEGMQKSASVHEDGGESNRRFFKQNELANAFSHPLDKGAYWEEEENLKCRTNRWKWMSLLNFPQGLFFASLFRYCLPFSGLFLV